METKTCRACGETKPTSAFGKQSQGRSHLQPYCRPCAVARAKAWRLAVQDDPAYKAREAARKRAERAANPEKAKADNLRWLEADRADGPLYLWKCAQKRAKARGIAFTITRADIVIPEFCPALGIRLEFGGTLAGRSNSPSLDRISPSLGYVPGNVQVISFKANTIKTDATADEIARVAAFVASLGTRTTE